MESRFGEQTYSLVPTAEKERCRGGSSLAPNSEKSKLS